MSHNPIPSPENIMPVSEIKRQVWHQGSAGRAHQELAPDFVEEDANPFSQTEQGEVTDYIPEELVTPELQKEVTKFQADPIPPDMVELVASDAKLIVDTFATMPDRDTQQRWWDRQNQRGMIVWSSATDFVIDEEELKRAVIETVTLHSGILHPAVWEEEFDPSIFMDIPMDEFDRIEAMSDQVFREVLEVIEKNPKASWTEALSGVMERLHAEGKSVTKMSSGFAWSNPGDVDIPEPTIETDQTQDIMKTFQNDWFKTQQYFKNKLQGQQEDADEQIQLINDADFEGILDELEIAYSEDFGIETDDPIVLTRIERDRAGIIGATIDRFLELGSEVVNPDGSVKQEGQQFLTFLQRMEDIGEIDDAGDVTKSIEQLKELREGLIGKDGVFVNANNHVAYLSNPENQYREMVTYFFNKKISPQFGSYEQVAGHVRDVIQNPGNYTNGYRFRVLSLFRGSHNKFSQVLGKAKESDELDGLLDLMVRNRNRGDFGGPEPHGFQDTGETVWNFWDPSAIIRNDDTGRAAALATSYYNQLWDRIGKSWSELSGEEWEGNFLAHQQLSEAFVLENGKHLRFDISIVDPVMLTAFTSIMMEDYINNPTEEVPLPLRDLGIFVKQYFGALDDDDLFDPQSTEKQQRVLSMLTTFRTMLDSEMSEGVRKQFLDALNIDKTEYRNLQLFMDALKAEDEEFWANPGEWFSINAGDPDALLAKFAKGRDIMSALGIAMATVFEDDIPAGWQAPFGSDQLFGNSNNNLLDGIQFHSEDDLVEYMESQGPDGKGLTNWQRIWGAFESAGITMPKLDDEETARAWLEEMLRDPDTGQMRRLFGRTSNKEDLQAILLEDYPHYGIALVLGLNTKSIDSRNRMQTFVNAMSLSGTGHRPTAVTVNKLADFFSNYGNGTTIAYASEEGEIFYTGSGMTDRWIEEADKVRLPKETIGETIGRVWANPLYAPGVFEHQYSNSIQSPETTTMLTDTFTIAEGTQAGDYWSIFINKIGLNPAKEENIQEWNNFIKETINEVQTEYGTFFRRKSNRDAFIKGKGGNADALPGNLDLTLEVMRRVFKAYPQVKNEMTGDHELTSLLGLHEHTLAGEPFTYGEVTVYTYPARVVAYPPTNRDLGTFLQEPSVAFEIQIRQSGAGMGDLTIPLPISMQENTFTWRRIFNDTVARGGAQPSISPEPGLITGSSARSIYEEQIRLRKERLEAETGATIGGARRRTGTDIIGGRPVER